MERVFKTKCHPEANGRKPDYGDEQWQVEFPLEDGSSLFVRMGRKGRDILFGMLIADHVDSNEDEPPLTQGESND